jgi:hypothetical protein
MRFIIERGGRSGAWEVEALAHILESNHHGGGKDGRLFVDHSPTKSGPGEEFRAVHVLLHDMTEIITAAIEAKKGTGAPPNIPAVWMDLARRYWAEAEAAELERIALETSPNGPNKKACETKRML